MTILPNATHKGKETKRNLSKNAPKNPNKKDTSLVESPILLQRKYSNVLGWTTTDKVTQEITSIVKMLDKLNNLTTKG